MKREAKQSFEVFTGLDHDGVWTSDRVQELETASGWQDVLRKAADFVVDRKARTLLLRHGAYWLRGSLLEWQAVLAEQERAPELTAEELASESSQARVALDSFNKALTATVEHLAGGLCEKPAQKEIAAELCDEIQRKRGKLKGKLEKALNNATEPKDAANEMIECIQEHAEDRIKKWHRDLLQGESASASAIDGLRQAAAKRLSTALTSARAEGGRCLDGVDFAPAVIFDAETLLNLIDEAENVDVEDHFDDDGKYYTPAESLLERGRRVVGWSDWRERMKDQIPHMIDSELVEQAKGIAKKHVKQLMNEAANQIHGVVRTEFKQFCAKINERIKKRESDLALSLPEKLRRADEARRTRSEVLEPFLRRLEDFIQRTQTALGVQE